MKELMSKGKGAIDNALLPAPGAAKDRARGTIRG
jgi:hypothetical protein